MAVALTEMERHMLEMLASAGKPTELRADDLKLGKLLEQRGLVLFVRESGLAVYLCRRAATRSQKSQSPKPGKKPTLGFLDQCSSRPVKVFQSEIARESLC